MNNIQKIQVELNENSLLNKVKFLKNIDIKNKRYINKNHYSLNFLVVCLSFLLLLYIFFLFGQKTKINNTTKKIIPDNIKELKAKNDFIVEPYIKSQKEFCEIQNKYYNKKYENEIFLKDVKLKGLKYKMYFYKTKNYVFKEIQKYGAYEIDISYNIKKALKFYGLKNNISNNKDIFMLDIGGNVGWYPSFLGRYNYTILSFEAFEKNYYISKKNFCYLNKDSNVIIITKGLGNKEKFCNYFKQKNNEGNGMIICNNKKIIDNKIIKHRQFIKQGEVRITTLKSFYPYLYNKNIALMKLDVEGNELQVLEGGKELITKYHIPFVVLEFSPYYLKEAGSKPQKLIEFFVDNNYRISLKGFLTRNYISSDELLSKAGFQINCYFIHNSMV